MSTLPSSFQKKSRAIGKTLFSVFLLLIHSTPAAYALSSFFSAKTFNHNQQQLQRRLQPLSETCEAAQPIVLQSLEQDVTIAREFPKQAGYFSLTSSTVDVDATTSSGGIVSCTGAESSDVSPSLWYSFVGTGEGMYASVCRDQTKFDARISIYSSNSKNDQCDELFCVIGASRRFGCPSPPDGVYLQVEETEGLDASASPSVTPSKSRSETPSSIPSSSPSAIPSSIPSSFPSAIPSSVSSSSPSAIQSSVPSSSPSAIQSSVPSSSPSAIQSSIPSSSPSAIQSSVPSSSPSAIQSSIPSSSPSAIQSSIPSNSPSAIPSTSTPTESPTIAPSTNPTASLTGVSSESLEPTAEGSTEVPTSNSSQASGGRRIESSSAFTDDDPLQSLRSVQVDLSESGIQGPCDVHWVAEEGKIYYIRVHSDGISEFGSFLLSVETLPEEHPLNEARSECDKERMLRQGPTAPQCQCIPDPANCGYHLTCVDSDCLKCNLDLDTCGFNSVEWEIKPGEDDETLTKTSSDTFYIVKEPKRGAEEMEVEKLFSSEECFEINDPYEVCTDTKEKAYSLTIAGGDINEDPRNVLLCECRYSAETGDVMLLCSLFDEWDYCVSGDGVNSGEDLVCASVLFGQVFSPYGMLESRFRTFDYVADKDGTVDVRRNSNGCQVFLDGAKCESCNIIDCNNGNVDPLLNGTALSEEMGIFTDMKVDCSNLELGGTFECGIASKNSSVALLNGELTPTNLEAPNGDEDIERDGKIFIRLQVRIFLRV